MKPQTKRKFLIAALFLSFLIFTFCLVPYSLLFSFLLFSFIGFSYLKFEFIELKKSGLFAHLPENIKTTLLTRSLFDILCDIWYIPSFSLYFKILLRPFIYQIRPEEAIENLSELNQAQRDKALIKGVIHLFPKTLQDMLIPQKEVLMIMNEKENKRDNTKKDDKKNRDNFKKNDKNLNNKFSNNDSLISNESTFDDCEEKKTEEFEEEEKVYIVNPENRLQINYMQQTSQNSQTFTYPEETDCIANKMNRISFFNFDKEEFSDKKFAFELFDQSETEINHKFLKKPSKLEIPQANNYVILDKNSSKKEQADLKGTAFKSFTTKVLASSKRIAQINLVDQMKKACEKSKQKWDRLENFLEDKLGTKSKWGEHHLKPAFGIPLRIVKMLQELKFSGIKMENQPLMKLFIGSNVFLGFLIFVSKRSRGWLLYSLLALLYAVGFVASTGSIVCFVMKYVVWRKKKKEVKKD